MGIMSSGQYQLAFKINNFVPGPLYLYLRIRSHINYPAILNGNLLL